MILNPRMHPIASARAADVMIDTVLGRIRVQTRGSRDAVVDPVLVVAGAEDATLVNSLVEDFPAG